MDGALRHARLADFGLAKDQASALWAVHLPFFTSLPLLLRSDKNEECFGTPSRDAKSRPGSALIPVSSCSGEGLENAWHHWHCRSLTVENGKL